MRKIILGLPIVALAACSNAGSTLPPPTISAQPASTVAAAVAATPVGQTVQQGLLDAEWNLDQAIKVGALPVSDPADACMHAALTQIGIEPSASGTPATPPASFTPKVSDLISGGSVLYILAQQALAAKASGGLAVPVSCEAVIGQFVIQAGAVGINAAPSVISAVAKLPVTP
jgi:hypothetical protein